MLSVGGHKNIVKRCEFHITWDISSPRCLLALLSNSMPYVVFKGEHPINTHSTVNRVYKTIFIGIFIRSNEYVCVITSSTCNMRCTVLTAMTIQIVVIQDGTPCSLGNEYRDFVEAAALISLQNII